MLFFLSVVHNLIAKLFLCVCFSCFCFIKNKPGGVGVWGLIVFLQCEVILRTTLLKQFREISVKEVVCICFSYQLIMVPQKLGDTGKAIGFNGDI